MLALTIPYAATENISNIIYSPNEITMAYDVINETIRRRRANKRDDITQTLRAGRYLVQLKEIIPHGQFQKYVTENTLYKYPREYQVDMQIYQKWKSHIEELIELGVIHNLDNVESEFVEGMNDEDVDVTATAFLKFAAGNMPEWALEAAVNHIERKVNSDDPTDRIDVLSIREAEKLVTAIKTVENIPNVEARDFARELVENYGVTNVEVLQFVPEVVKNTPSIMEEIRSTGMVSVAGVNNGQGRQIDVDKIGKTDLEIALGYESIEKHLETNANIRVQLETQSHYEWITAIRGTPAQIMQQLSQHLTQEDGQYQIKISVLKK